MPGRPQQSKKTVSPRPLQDDVPVERAVAAASSGHEACRAARGSTRPRAKSRALAGSSGKYIRVTSRRIRPRAKTETARCGACGAPAGPGTGPGLMVREAEAAVGVGRRRGRSRGTPGRRACPACPRDGRTSRARWPARSRASASGTGSPSPSRTRPSMVTRSPGDAGRGQIVAGQPGEPERRRTGPRSATSWPGGSAQPPSAWRRGR